MSPSDAGESLRMPRPSRWRAWAAFGLATICLLGFYWWSYGDCLDGFFYRDDFWELKAANDIHIRAPLDLLQFFRPVPSFVLYRPVSTVLYFFVLQAVFGHDPTSYHAVQLAFHVLNALLVYAIAGRLLGSRALGLAAAFVYALAPGHVIAVQWIATFNMTGTAFFYFFGLWTWLRRDTRGRLLATWLVFVVALLAGEHAVTFPLALTLAAVLLEPQRPWRHIARQQAAFYGLALLYVAAKLYYLLHALPAANPIGAAVAQRAYGMRFGPRMALRHLGRYLGFAIDALLLLPAPEAWALAAGGIVVAVAAVATVGVLVGRWQACPLRVATFGLDLFIVTLLPVVFLREHLEPYYVGIAALGIALAVVGVLQLVRRASVATGLLVVALLGIHATSGATLGRQNLESFLFIVGSELAADWLSTLATLDDASVQEVVVPKDAATVMVFDRGDAQRVLLCAGYRVRTSAAIDREVPGPGRVILRAPRPLAQHGPPRPWLPRRCAEP